MLELKLDVEVEVGGQTPVGREKWEQTHIHRVVARTRRALPATHHSFHKRITERYSINHYFTLYKRT
jgi:hypothetical protein